MEIKVHDVLDMIVGSIDTDISHTLVYPTIKAASADMRLTIEKNPSNNEIVTKFFKTSTVTLSMGGHLIKTPAFYSADRVIHKINMCPYSSICFIQTTEDYTYDTLRVMISLEFGFDIDSLLVRMKCHKKLFTVLPSI